MPEEPPFAFDATPDPDVPEEVEAETLKKITDEVSNIFSVLESNGVQELPRQVFNQLQELIKKAVDTSADQIQNAKESYARTRAKRLEKKVWDIFVEAKWDREVFRKYIDYVTVHGTCVVAGPIMKNVAKNVIVRDRKTGVRRIVRKVKTIPTFEALNPVDCYPAPGAVDVCDGPLCIRQKYKANELWRYVDNAEKSDLKVDSEGWRVHAVNKILALHPNGGVHISTDTRNPDISKAERNGSGTENVNDCTFEGVRCFASVRGQMLLEMGITRTLANEKIKQRDFYYIETVVIDNTVVYCRIYDDRIGVPLSKGVFYELPGSWWGESIADKVACCQNVMNNAIKSLMQNMGVGSGPMYWMNDLTRLADKSGDGMKPRPHKIFTFTASQMGNTGAPMGVLSVPMVADQLLGVFNAMTKQADLDSGIPAFSEGTGGSASGALRTAEGLKVFMEATHRGMQMLVWTTDNLVISDMARRVADWVLLYDDDMSLKGDVEVRPVGLMGKVLKAQNDQARLQLFNMVVNNQYMQQLVGVKGIVALFRPSLKDLNINPDNICPNEERMEYLEQLEQIKQIFLATAAKGQDGGASGGGEGAPPGVDQPPAIKGGVAQRRAVA